MPAKVVLRQTKILDNLGSLVCCVNSGSLYSFEWEGPRRRGRVCEIHFDAVALSGKDFLLKLAFGSFQGVLLASLENRVNFLL